MASRRRDTVFRTGTLREAKETILPPVFRRLPLKDLLKRVSAKAELSSDTLLRKGRLANVIEARDRFVREAVLEQGYLASQVAEFLVCHPSNVSRAPQKS